MGIDLYRLRRPDDAEPAADSDVAAAADTRAAAPATDSGVAAPALAVADATGHPAARATGWDALAAAVRECRLCELHRTRTQTVFGVGRRDADLLVIGEAPGADEDRQGEPFVGRAGQLLTAMLRAIGLAREDVYIANILKCRPPGNRDPRPAEIRQCTPYLERQLALIAPRAVLAVGRIAAQHLLQSDQPIGRLRGKVASFGQDRVPLVVTYHPAYLLRSPAAKAKAWQDLCLVRRLIRESE